MGERLEISGTGGTLVVDSGVMRVRELKDYRGETSFYGRKVDAYQPAAEGVPEGAADPASISGDSHQAQIRDLLDAIDEDRDPFVTGREGRHALEVVLGVYDSAQRGTEVAFTPVSEVAQ
jgi:predicted dehydrogenase